MAEPSPVEAFDKALEDLEKLADIRSNMIERLWDRLDQEINHMLDSMVAAMCRRSKRLLDGVLGHLQRLAIVRTKLDKCDSSYSIKDMDFLVDELFSAATSLLDQTSNPEVRPPVYVTLWDSLVGKRFSAVTSSPKQTLNPEVLLPAYVTLSVFNSCNTD